MSRQWLKNHNISHCSLGQGLAEYLIIVVVVGIILIVAVRQFGGSLVGQFTGAAESVETLNSDETRQNSQSAKTANSSSDTTLGKGSLSSGSDSRGSSEQQSSAGTENALAAGSAGVTNKSLTTSQNEASQNSSLDSKVSTLTVGVGDSERQIVESIPLDWNFLLSMAAGVVLFGVLVVFYRTRKNRKSRTKSGAGEEKKEAFSLFSSNKGSGEEGQVLLIGLIVCLGLVMVSISVANIGMMVAEKIQLQDTVDAAAYSAAVQEARYMNLSAYLNRTMVANYDTMAFNTSLWSMADAGDHGMAALVSLLYQIDAVLILFPFTTAVGKSLDDFIDILREDVHDPLHDFNHSLNEIYAQDDESSDLNGLIETYNTDILSTYQGLLYAAQQASRHEVIREVAKRNDREVVTTTVLGLGAEALNYDELARAVNWVVEDPDALEQPFSSLQEAFKRMGGEPEDDKDNPLLLAAVTEASLNRFSAGRERDGNLDGLRNLGIGNILPLGGLETAFDIECNIAEKIRANSPLALVTDALDCNAKIEFNLGFNLRDGYEDKADQEHVPFIGRRRMREVTTFGMKFDVSGLGGPLGSAFSELVKEYEGEKGHTSAEKHADIGNVANSTLSFEGIDFDRAFETFKHYGYDQCAIGKPIPTCGLNSMNILEASIMLPNVAPPIIPPLFVDDHWDGSFDKIYPIYSYQLIVFGEGNVEVLKYTPRVASEGTEEGVPKYDWQVDLNNVGFPNYIYPDEGADIRPDGTSGGDNKNLLTGPSVAVIGTKARSEINGLPGLGLRNPYSMSAISRAQVYYLRNPNRPDELPSLFNPHWVARLAPIDGEDSPELLKEGLPFVSSVGVPLTPTH